MLVDRENDKLLIGYSMIQVSCLSSKLLHSVIV
ncbi:MAG: hypothetical protein ACJAUQ_001424, partial [Maribacter sp.]